MGPPAAEHTVARRLNRLDGQLALGLLLLMASLYCLTGPGRIDIIDGQFRYDVARSLLDGHGFQVRDPVLRFGPRGLDGHLYSDYGPGASILAVPLVAWARAIGGDRNSEMFFFSFTSAIAASVCVAAFYLFRRRLGDPPRWAVSWAIVLAVASPLWPLAVTVFHQAQQITVLFLGMFLAWEGALRKSWPICLVAGVVGGSAVLVDKSLILLLPSLGLSSLEGAGVGRSQVLDGRSMRHGLLRYVAFGAGCLVPCCLWMVFNIVRFGGAFEMGSPSQPGHPPLWGNPVMGLIGVLLSPGKSIFLFFPTLALLAFGFAGFLRSAPMLTWSIVATVTTQLIFISCLTFWGSDWAWGSRYIMFLAPLLMLPCSLADTTQRQRTMAVGVISVGFVVQALGVSVDHQRFFFENRLSAYFWYTDQAAYFQFSQLLSRPAELISILFDIQMPAVAFRPGPYPQWPTYAVFGGPPASSDIWMRVYSVFYLPRPWPLWVFHVEESLRPVGAIGALAICLLLGATGTLLVGIGLKKTWGGEA